MFQKIAPLASSGFFLSGLAVLSPAACFFLLGRQYSGPQCAAILGTFLVLMLSWGPIMEAAALAAAGAAALISGLALLPLLGVKTTSAIGILLLACGLILRGARSLSPDVRGARAGIIIALAAGSCVAWTRCLSLLIGHPHYAFTLALSALFLGFALSSWLKKNSGADFEPALALLLSGVIGLFILRFFRFIGINSGGAHYIQFHLHTRADIFFIAGQAYAVVCLWALALSYGGNSKNPSSAPEKSGKAALWFCLALAGPAAGYGLLILIGPAKTAAVFNLALIGLGFWTIGWGALLKSPVLAKTSAATAAIAIGLNAANPDPFRDIWLNRLNAAYPGGSFLFFNDDGGESLGAYQFSSGAKVLLSEGIASFSAEQSAKRAAFLPLLLRPAVKSVLLLGVRDPAVIDAFLSQSISLDAVDPHPGYPSILKALDEKIKLEQPGQLTIIRENIHRHLERQSRGRDLIFLELAAPLETAPNAFKTTKSFFTLAQSRLNPAGALIARAPASAGETSQLRIARTLQDIFPHVIACRLGNNLLFFASQDPFNTEIEFLKTRLSSDLWIFDPDLESFLQKELVWLDEEKLKALAAALHPESDDRPLNAFPLYDIMNRSFHD